MNQNKLIHALDGYVKKYAANTKTYEEEAQQRKDRSNYYKSYNAKKIRSMTEDDMYEYISKLWSMLIWGNKKYIVDKLISDNGFEALKDHLIELLYGNKPIEVRWDHFHKEVKGLGPASMSELLSNVSPCDYVIFNKNTVICFNYLGIADMPKYDYQYTGKKYVEVCNSAKEIAGLMEQKELPDTSMIAVDYFMWDEILPLTGKTVAVIEAPIEAAKSSKIATKSIHSELQSKIVSIGALLGFESRAEVKIAAGAIVDAVWEAKIGNMGKAIYVFEIQSSGSIDSLILNLKKAQSNAAVQAVVAVTDEKQIEVVKRESKGVIDEKSLRTWEAEDVIAVYDSLTRAHESINKLSLVPDSF